MTGDGEQGVGRGERPLHVLGGGKLWSRPVRRILALSGYRVTTDRPGPDDLVGVWGRSPDVHREEAAARAGGARLVRVEHAWFRSPFPTHGLPWPPPGLLIDDRGMHFDPSRPSALEDLLATHPLDDTALLDRARGGMARMMEAGLTTYTASDPDAPLPEPGYVLVLDQARGDASVAASGADRNRFLEMLYWAQENHPGARIVIKPQPETLRGDRTGHFTQDDANDRVTIFPAPVSPWRLFDGAVAVYAVSSQGGFEAILAGHRPHVFGQPFYAGWGLTEDSFPVPRRRRKLTRAQLFAAAVLLYPSWYDPFRDRLCSYEDAAEILAEETRAWLADRKGWVASRIPFRQRGSFRRRFGSHGPITFENDPHRARAKAKDRPWMVGASEAAPPDLWSGAARVASGFLRSSGPGAELVPAMSIVLDDLGDCHDPRNPSRLERLIASRATLRPDQAARARRLIRALTDPDTTQPELGQPTDGLPQGHRILVAGQAKDDASLQTGAGEVPTDRALLEAAREANPGAILLYTPPRENGVGPCTAAVDPAMIADRILTDNDPSAVLAHVQEVWTATSLLGFEALLRGVPVTTLGTPFYAGWGLTRDLGAGTSRRTGHITLEGLVHATLIDYPRYFDPDTGRPCPVEVVVARLTEGAAAPRRPLNRTLSKLHALVAGQNPSRRR